MDGKYVELIAAHDETLKILSQAWQDSRPNLRGDWMAKINKALDQRLELMKKRDES